MPLFDNTNTDNTAILIVVFGDSNGVGQGLNSSLPAPELLPRPAVQIWVPTGTFADSQAGAFAALDIGTNNQGGSASLHGCESGIANAVEAGVLTNYSQVYMLKAASGGASTYEWMPGSRNINILQARFAGAYKALIAAGKTVQVVLCGFQGPNDVADGITVDDTRFYINVLVSSLRDICGQVPLLMAKCPLDGTNSTPKNNINAIWNTKNLEDPFYIPMKVNGIPLQDEYHFTSAGYTTLGYNFMRVLNANIGNFVAYARNQANALTRLGMMGIAGVTSMCGTGGGGAGTINMGGSQYPTTLVNCRINSLTGQVIWPGPTNPAGYTLNAVMDSTVTFRTFMQVDATLANSAGIYHCITEDPSNNYDINGTGGKYSTFHNGQTGVICGILHLPDGSLYYIDYANTQVDTGFDLAPGEFASMRTSGNDVIIETSPTGSVWTVRGTLANCIAGKTVPLYLKTMTNGNIANALSLTGAFSQSAST